MAIYNGQNASGLVGRPLDERTWLSVNMQTGDEYTYNPNIVSIGSPQSGAYFGLAPSYVLHDWDAAPVESVNSALYFRYLMIRDAQISTQISFGAASPGQTIDVGIWNGFGRGDTVASISISQSNAISISGLSVGTTFGNYEEITIELAILSTAGLRINCDITISFDSGESVSFNVIGVLASAVLFVPESHMLEFISFLTNIITAKDGTEQRRALRLYPRHSLAVNWLETNPTEANKVKNVASGKAATSIGNGFWQMNRHVNTQPSADDTVIFVDTSYAIYKEGADIILWEEGGSVYEIGTISTFDGSSITLEDPIVNTYSNAIVAPYYFMKPSAPISWKDHVNHTAFDLESLMAETIDVDEWTFTDTYNGIGIMPYDCNLFESDSTETKLLNTYEEFDGQTGVFTKSQKWDASKQVTRFGIHATTRGDCWKMRQLCYYLRGRQKTVWVPTLDRDFVPTADLGGTEINCEENGYATYVFSDDAILKHIAVYENGQAPAYSEITAASEGDGAQLLTLDSSLSVADKDDVKISFLTLSHLNTDTIEIEWISPEECYCILEFIGVKE